MIAPGQALRAGGSSLEMARPKTTTLACLILSGVLALVLLGCSSGDESRGDVDYSQRFAAYEPAVEPNGDLARVVWPEFVLRAGPEVQELYAFQIENGELMRFMPCFCGCGGQDGHRSNRDCYVREVRADGSVVLDSMAPT